LLYKYSSKIGLKQFFLFNQQVNLWIFIARKMKILHPRVNFINVLRACFSHKILAPKIIKLTFGFEILAPKILYEKCALLKLTPSCFVICTLLRQEEKMFGWCKKIKYLSDPKKSFSYKNDNFKLKLFHDNNV